MHKTGKYNVRLMRKSSPSKMGAESQAGFTKKSNKLLKKINQVLMNVFSSRLDISVCVPIVYED